MREFFCRKKYHIFGFLLSDKINFCMIHIAWTFHDTAYQEGAQTLLLPGKATVHDAHSGQQAGGKIREIGSNTSSCETRIFRLG